MYRLFRCIPSLAYYLALNNVKFPSKMNNPWTRYLAFYQEQKNDTKLTSFNFQK